MNFYQHIERWGTDEVSYLKDLETVTVMPKIDGTNGAVVFKGSEMTVCSRHRVISVEQDNEGFCKFVNDHKEEFELLYYQISRFLSNTVFAQDSTNADTLGVDALSEKTITLFGEFTKKGTYTVSKEFLHKFCLFDIVVELKGENDPELKYFNPNDIDFLRDYCFNNIIVVPSEDMPVSGVDNLVNTHVEFSKFLLPDVYPHGEGFVIKDYSNHKNQFNRTTWAKLLFEKVKITTNIYDDIRDNWFTEEFLNKEYNKYTDTFKEKLNVNKFSNIVVREFFKEELANVVFKNKFPLIDTSKLKAMLLNKAIDFAKQKLF